jgi:hypothetical protein
MTSHYNSLANVILWLVVTAASVARVAVISSRVLKIRESLIERLGSYLVNKKQLFYTGDLDIIYSTCNHAQKGWNDDHPHHQSLNRLKLLVVGIRLMTLLPPKETT